MSKIQVLSEEVANRIAAGEVIERPASVVKELVENALDAGATRIRVMVEKAGVKLIGVIDNGSGMDEDDALCCFEAHGTSKIRSDADLHSIASYGFRGEAIPSVASISRTTLRTRIADASAGFEVEVVAGSIQKTIPIGCANGTEFLVRDLFFNVPARRKFLRSDATEERHIFEIVLNMALPNPQVAFELLFDGRMMVQSPASTDYLPRMQCFFGKSFSDEMISLSYEESNIKIGGYIARHGVTKTTRREQRFFVNGRAIEALACFNGVKEGYGSLIEKGCYPPVVLFIEIDPKEIDINVHPAKKEIRFHHERAVIHAISNAIINLLQKTGAPAIAVDTPFSLRSMLSGSEIQYRPSSNIESLTEDLPKFLKPETAPIIIENLHLNKETPIDKVVYSVPISENQQHQNSIDDTKEAPITTAYLPPIEPVAIISETYILATHLDGLVIIDQHAAHERVLFEQLLKQAKLKLSEHTLSQRLLMPIVVELSRAEVVLVQRYTTLFSEIGFEINTIGPTTFLLNSIPVGIPQNALLALFHQLLDELYNEEVSGGKNISIDALARAACKAAVKAHDRLTLQESRALIMQMSQCEMPFSCPHGRPTLIHFSIKELEKRFSRIN